MTTNINKIGWITTCGYQKISTFCFFNQSLDTVHVVLLKKKKDSIWLQSFRVFLLRRENRKRQFYFYGLAHRPRFSLTKNKLFAIRWSKNCCKGGLVSICYQLSSFRNFLSDWNVTARRRTCLKQLKEIQFQVNTFVWYDWNARLTRVLPGTCPNRRLIRNKRKIKTDETKWPTNQLQAML